jgi:hypothetical protein
MTLRSRAEGRRGTDVIDLWQRHGRRHPAVVDVARAHAAHRRRSGGGESEAGAREPRGGVLLTDEELRAIESTYPDGITAVQIVEVFTSRGVKFSEASFRKYVQQGLLPRSRRVGRKGKHRGSLGVYPAKTVRRINTVKQLMDDGHTIEEIQAEFLQYTDLVESIAEGLTALLARLGTDVDGPRLDEKTKKTLGRDLADARHAADDLMRQLDELARRVAAPATDRIRRTGAAGSAEDLL